jgi:RHS repeat-associated protein
MLGVAHRGALVVALAVLNLGAAAPRRVVVNPIEVSVEAANAGLEALRSECLSVRAGPGAIQCDDFVFRYDFMPLLRLQRPRTLSLLYNSATAYPRPVVGANILIPTGQSVPDEVRARLLVDGVVLDSLTVNGALLSAGVPLRVAFTFEQYEERGNRIVPFTVEVTAWDNAQAGATASDEGHYIIVDRREEFGRGWWPTGYEKLEFSAVNDTLLWVGGDGSARAYAPVSTFANQWKAVTRARPDTIKLEAVDSAYYLDLDGTEYGTVSNPAGLEDVSRMTWAFWLYPTGYSGRIGGMSSGSDPNRVWWFEADDSGTEFVTVLFNDSIGEPVYRTTTGDALSSNTWQFVVVQFDGTQSTASQRLKLWINGQSETLSVPDGMYNYPLPSSLASSATAPFQWGSVSAYTPGFKGRIGETAILDTVLSSTERGAWLAAGIDFDHAGLVSGYRWENNLTDSEGVNTLSAQGIGSGDYVPTLAYRSRSISATGSYHRSLIGGGEVEYNATGRHVQTVDRIGNVTEFVHTTVPGTGEVRLSSILLPKFSGRDTAFVFQWDSLRLLAVKVRFRDSGDQKWLSYLVSTDTTPGGQPDHDAYTIRHITTPSGDGRSFYFGYEDWKGVLDSIQDFRGASTVLSYTNSKVSQVRTLATAYVDTLKYEAYATVGSGTSGALAPVDTASVSARLDGPRTDVGDTTRFWPTGWGAVRKVRDALGAETSVARGNTSYPALPTLVTYPNGRKVSAAYNGIGLLEAVTDSSISATTTFAWDTLWSRVKKITSPENVVTLRAYAVGNGNLLRETVGNDTTVHTTRYSYHEPNGLITRIRPPGYGVDTTYIFGYDTWGNVNSQGTPKGFVTYTHKDPMGRDTLIVTPIHGDTTQARRVYRDVMGRDTLSVTSNELDDVWLHVHTTYSDSTGDRIKVHPFGSDTVGANDSTSTGETLWTYDALGRVVTETGAATDSLVYDLVGNVLRRYRGASVVGLELADSMVYDAVNRLKARVVPARTYAPSGGIDTIPFYSPSGLSIPRDSASFTYDVLGNIETANNGYAQITRSYEPDGMLEREIARIRTYGGSTFTTHVDTTDYVYDKDRRLKELHHPNHLHSGYTALAYDSLGRLSSVTTPSNYTMTYGYDVRERPFRMTFPEGVDSLVYDLDGRLASRRLRIASTTYFELAMTYDDRDLVTDANNTATSLLEYSDLTYDGLGHLAESIITHWQGVPTTREVFQTDGFGRIVIRDDLSDVEPVRYVESHEQALGGPPTGAEERYVRDDPPSYCVLEWDPSTRYYNYDSNGNRDWTAEWRHSWLLPENCPDYAQKLVTWQEQSKSFYSADDRLMYFQANRDSIDFTVGGQPEEGHWGAYEEYWYDALGRRVLKRTRQESPHCEIYARCISSIERYVWSGDELLWEIRSTNENDLNETDPTPDSQNGTIGYVQAGGIDAPIAVIRNGQTHFLHRGWRGLYAFSTKTDGALATCTPLPSGGCENVAWAAGYTSSYIDDRRVDYPAWYGSIVTSSADASGLLYRRNRYYDPEAGTFTQGDPIGIAGGLNLYGYAGGDPINYSDPFGLSECEKIPGEDERRACETRVAGEGEKETQAEGGSCAAAWGIFGLSLGGDIALGGTVTVGVRALSRGGVLLARATANASHGAALLASGGAVATQLGWSTKGVAATQGLTGVAYRRLGAAVLGGGVASSFGGDVEINTYAAASGFDVSLWDFVPVVATVRAYQNARRVCR